jgi:hypothetical protein
VLTIVVVAQPIDDLVPFRLRVSLQLIMPRFASLSAWAEMRLGSVVRPVTMRTVDVSAVFTWSEELMGCLLNGGTNADQ